MKTRTNSDLKVINLREAVNSQLKRAISCSSHDAAVDPRHLQLLKSKACA